MTIFTTQHNTTPSLQRKKPKQRMQAYGTTKRRNRRRSMFVRFTELRNRGYGTGTGTGTGTGPGPEVGKVAVDICWVLGAIRVDEMEFKGETVPCFVITCSSTPAHSPNAHHAEVAPHLNSQAHDSMLGWEKEQSQIRPLHIHAHPRPIPTPLARSLSLPSKRIPSPNHHLSASRPQTKPPQIIIRHTLPCS
ncbi:hypothetical protein EYC84_001662 [Monilinia fructicola]|uniref:Uncharacterized protein n=1 Tax=Monilinia fructicola TaxID=38448 RepID=A0A5M9JUW7_MONFR|nr:hypothetical protein EYC84_001662 [Monilinia fructicola]